MSKYLCYNGEIKPANELVLTADNRSFNYGDGVFETIRCINSEPIFFSNHYQRLLKSLSILKIELPEEFTENYFKFQINKLLKKNRIYKGGRARLTLFRNSGGLYTPTSNSAGFILTISELPSEKFELNHKGLAVSVYKDNVKAIHPLSAIKSCNALIFVMAGLFKYKNNFDDCFILNTGNKIIEAISSNVFVMKDNKLITPSIETGCVDGTMRRTIIKLSHQLGIPCIESKGLTIENIESADEVFLTNAIQGVVWVGSYKLHRYYHTIASQLVVELNKNLD